MTGRHDLGGAVHGGAEVVTAPLLGLPAVDPHPHPQRTGLAPRLAPTRPRCAREARRDPRRARRGKTAIIPSPVVLITVPPDPSMASRRIASCPRRATCMPSGYGSHRRVLPSRSVNRKVRVPVAGICTCSSSGFNRETARPYSGADGSHPARHLPHRRHLRLHRATWPTSSWTTLRTSSRTSSAPWSRPSGPDFRLAKLEGDAAFMFA